MAISFPRGLIVPVGIIAVLEILAVALLGAENYTFAAPHDIAVALVRTLLDGSLLIATAETLTCAFAVLFIGFAGGVAAGVLLGLSHTADRLFSVPVELLRPVPPAALIPLMLLVSGFGFQMETTIVAFTTFWPILILARAAIRAVEPGLVEVARVLELGMMRRIFSIVIPSALPRLFVAFRLSAGIALTVAVVVGVVASPRGIGYGMIVSAQTLHADVSLAWLAWIALIGFALNAVLNYIDTHVFERFR